MFSNRQRDTSNSFSLNGVGTNNLFNGNPTSPVADNRFVLNTGESFGAGGTIVTATSVYAAIGEALPTPAPEIIERFASTRPTMTLPRDRIEALISEYRLSPAPTTFMANFTRSFRTGVAAGQTFPNGQFLIPLPTITDVNYGKFSGLRRAGAGSGVLRERGPGRGERGLPPER